MSLLEKFYPKPFVKGGGNGGVPTNGNLLVVQGRHNIRASLVINPNIDPYNGCHLDDIVLNISIEQEGSTKQIPLLTLEELLRLPNTFNEACYLGLLGELIANTIVEEYLQRHNGSTSLSFESLRGEKYTVVGINERYIAFFGNHNTIVVRGITNRIREQRTGGGKTQLRRYTSQAVSRNKDFIKGVSVGQKLSLDDIKDYYPHALAEIDGVVRYQLGETTGLILVESKTGGFSGNSFDRTIPVRIPVTNGGEYVDMDKQKPVPNGEDMPTDNVVEYLVDMPGVKKRLFEPLAELLGAKAIDYLLFSVPERVYLTPDTKFMRGRRYRGCLLQPRMTDRVTRFTSPKRNKHGQEERVNGMPYGFPIFTFTQSQREIYRIAEELYRLRQEYNGREAVVTRTESTS